MGSGVTNVTVTLDGRVLAGQPMWSIELVDTRAVDQFIELLCEARARQAEINGEELPFSEPPSGEDVW